jgi:hypothetical protein
MNNQLLLIKFKQRLNKLASFDYDNIESWQVVEAFNKTQLEVSRRESAKGEADRRTIENLQVILKQAPIKGTHKRLYFESANIPPDFLAFKRISCDALTSTCTEPRRMKTYLVEEANIDDLLSDPDRNPNFEWGETIVTIIDSKLRIYTSGKFQVKTPVLTYYREPRPISIIGTVDPATGDVSSVEQTCEFSDAFTELIIDEAAALVAGDIESFNQVQRLAGRSTQ